MTETNNTNNKLEHDNKSLQEVGKGIGFERIRRITGYLVGTIDRFNDGKKAEEKDRVKHTFGGQNENNK